MIGIDHKRVYKDLSQQHTRAHPNVGSPIQDGRLSPHSPRHRNLEVLLSLPCPWRGPLAWGWMNRFLPPRAEDRKGRNPLRLPTVRSAEPRCCDGTALQISKGWILISTTSISNQVPSIVQSSQYQMSIHYNGASRLVDGLVTFHSKGYIHR